MIMGNAKQWSMDAPIYRAASEGSFLTAATAEVNRTSTAMDHGSSSALEVHEVQCECCGLSEECTPGYICRVRDLFCGHWVCGLCAEAVKEERHRMGRGTAMQDALRAHMSICVRFNKLAREKPALYLADGMKQLLRRHLNAKGLCSKPKYSRPHGRTNLPIRSSSCMPALTITEQDYCNSSTVLSCEKCSPVA